MRTVQHDSITALFLPFTNRDDSWSHLAFGSPFRDCDEQA
jgi:hypothetical protein